MRYNFCFLNMVIIYIVILIYVRFVLILIDLCMDQIDNYLFEDLSDDDFFQGWDVLIEFFVVIDEFNGCFNLVIQFQGVEFFFKVFEQVLYFRVNILNDVKFDKVFDEGLMSGGIVQYQESSQSFFFFYGCFICF